MNSPNSPDDAALRALLKSSRPAPTLPPRFEEQVWRRIEAAAAPQEAAPRWLTALAGWFLQPRLAVAAAILVIAAGAGLGRATAQQQSLQTAQARYLAAVAPNSLH